MYRLNLIFFVKILAIISIKHIQCTIDGTIRYPDPKQTKAAESNPCNPLYWYPRHIPEWCYYKKEITTEASFQYEPPIPMPIPVPVPPSMPPPMHPPPMPYPYLPMLPAMPFPQPLPFGIPLAPSSPMLPVAGIPYSPVYPQPLVPPPFSFAPQPYNPPPLPEPYNIPPFPPSPSGPYNMKPGTPGLLRCDGGVNVLPFSDVYSDWWKKYKKQIEEKRVYPRVDKDSDERRYMNEIPDDEVLPKRDFESGRRRIMRTRTSNEDFHHLFDLNINM